MQSRAQSTDRPSRVVLEKLPDGRQSARLVDNIEEVEVEESTVYEYDEVTFFLPREATAKEVEKDFEAWWIYGCESHEPPTLEERVEMLEELVEDMI